MNSLENYRTWKVKSKPINDRRLANVGDLMLLMPHLLTQLSSTRCVVIIYNESAKITSIIKQNNKKMVEAGQSRVVLILK